MQHKAIARSTDSRLLETVRAELVGVAKNAGVDLNQPLAEESKELGRKFRRLQREIDRKVPAIGQAVREALAETLNKAERISAQTAQLKSAAGQPKSLCSGSICACAR